MPVVNTAKVRLRVTNKTSMQEPFARGWDVTTDFGMRGTLFVDQATGSDANGGRSLEQAFATLGAAQAAAGDGDRVKVRSGTYREQITVNTGVIWEAYGTDRPILSGAASTTGWTQCGVGDQARVGADYASIYKLTVPVASIAGSNPFNLNLHEAGKRLYVCREWNETLDWKTLKYEEQYGISRFFGEYNQSNFATADEMYFKNTDEIDGYKIPAITNKYTQAQIEQALVYAYFSPNAVGELRVDNFDPVTDKITVVNVGSNPLKPQGGVSNPVKRLALFNLLPAMQQGQFGWWAEADTSITIYAWPNDPVNIAAGMEYSTQTLGFDFEGDSCAVRGFDIRQQAGTGTGNGMGVRAQSTASKNVSKVSVEFCRVKGVRHNNDRAAIFLTGAQSLVNRCTIEDAQNAFGVFLSTPGFSRMRRCYMINCAKAPLRSFGNKDSIFDHNQAVACGSAAHANKANWYQGPIRTLITGNVFSDCDGYATFQDASQLYVFGNYIPATYNVSNGNSSRAFIDQNRSSTDSPIAAGPFVFCNNSLIPQPEVNGTALSTVSNTLELGSTNANHSQVVFDVVNNYFHGGGSGGQTNFRDYNVNSRSDQATIGANDIGEPIEAIFVDPIGGDWSVKPAAILRTATGMSLESYIAGTLEPLFGDRFSGWNVDAAGKTFDVTAPPVGCFSDADDYAVYQNLLLNTP